MIDLNKYLAKKDNGAVKTIAEHNADLKHCLDCLAEFGYIKRDEIFDLTSSAIYYHDFGKIQKGFQERITSDKHRKYASEKEIFHNLLSAYFIDKNDFENISDYCRVCFAVLNHHDYCNTNDEINNNEKEYLKFLETEEFAGEYRKSLRRYIGKIQQVAEDNKTILIKGLLNKCDYSASGEYKIEYKNDFTTQGLENLMHKWQEKNPKAAWNDLQKFCKDNSHKNIIAVAQTGMGKTEAGLHWIGNNKGFFILPLRTAINAMYERFKNNIAAEKTDERVALLYGDSLSYYVDNIKEEMDMDEYNKRGKNLTMPLTVSTPDQIFDFVFKYNGYELKLAVMSYSKIVLDEIQMYSPDLLAYILYGLKRINDLGGKIAVVTATLTPFIREKLKFLNAACGEFTDDSIRHNMCVKNCKINTDDIIEYFNEKQNKVLVVCNTIKKAQQIYDELCEKTDADNLHIFHSRFTKKDRKKLEKDIMEFGKTEFKGEGIWISTSVVEASLDIDFDCLFTELNELTSLFQRLGRCNRKGVKDTSKTNCYVYLEVDKVYEGMETLYDLSKDCILGWNGEISEKDKINLINKAFTTENLKNSEYVKKFNEYYNAINDMSLYQISKNSVKFREINSVDVIPSPVYKEHLTEINECLKLLENGGMTVEERTKLKNQIMEYTVSVPMYIFDNYKRALNKGTADKYAAIVISKHLKINVIECNYDKKGFSSVNFETEIREVNML